MDLLSSQPAFSAFFSAKAENPLYPCTFSRARNFSAPRKLEMAHFAFQTCTTKNASILGAKRANLVGMVGFSTLPKSEEGQPKESCAGMSEV